MFQSISTAPYSYTGFREEVKKASSIKGSNSDPKKSTMRKMGLDTRNSGQSSDFKLKIHHT